MSWLAKTEEQRFTLAVAYPAEELDAQGEFMSAEELEKAAWSALRAGIEIGLNHKSGTAGAGEVVESYIWRGAPWTINGQTVKAGDWLLGVVWEPDTWEAIKAGEFEGMSLQGWASRKAKADEADVNVSPEDPEKVIGIIRALLAKLTPEQRQKAFDDADFGRPSPEEVVERLDLKKSKPAPGSFTALVEDARREWNQSFADSLKTDEKPVEVFSKAHLAAERERVEKDDEDTPPRTIWGRRKGPSITHCG